MTAVDNCDHQVLRGLAGFSNIYRCDACGGLVLMPGQAVSRIRSALEEADRIDQEARTAKESGLG